MSFSDRVKIKNLTNALSESETKRRDAESQRWLLEKKYKALELQLKEKSETFEKLDKEKSEGFEE